MVSCSFLPVKVALIFLILSFSINICLGEQPLFTSRDEMVLIPGGKFLMGSSDKDGRVGMSVGVDELPQHEVDLPSFFMDKYEVTNRHYKRFIDVANHPPPVDEYKGAYSWIETYPPEGQEDLPVTHVSWYDAEAYCKWIGKKLPTETEWEKAARGTDGRQWPWGNEFKPDYCNVKYTGAGKILPVSSIPGDKSPYGVYDMCGNVSEWTSSWYLPYPGSTLKRESFGEIHKVVRGGSWVMPDIPYSRIPYRSNKNTPTHRHRGLGFRCAKDADYAGMIYISGGEFLMGSSEKDGKIGRSIGVDELPQHRVFVSGFYIDRYEVTVGEYKRFLEITGRKGPRLWTNEELKRLYPGSNDNHPMNAVSWYDADAYCRWVGKRLPTEQEWEKAARGIDGRQFPWGDEPNKPEKILANTIERGAGWTLPVGSFSDDVSPFGLYDMAGNVAEWTSSWYKAYSGSTLQRESFGEKNKVLKGGSWENSSVPYARSAYRRQDEPEDDHPAYGFRCAIDK